MPAGGTGPYLGWGALAKGRDRYKLSKKRRQNDLIDVTYNSKLTFALLAQYDQILILLSR